MKTKEVKIEKVSISKYKEVFRDYLKCKAGDFEIKNDTYGKMVSHKDGDIYNVWSQYDIESYAEECLSTELAYVMYPYFVVAEIAGEVHMDDSFYFNFLDAIEGREEYTKLLNDFNLALSLSKKYNDSYSVFWKTIYSIQSEDTNEMGIYTQCVKSLFETYDKEALIDEFIEELISCNLLNEMQKGICEIVTSKNDEDTFYIFTIDPMRWETK